MVNLHRNADYNPSTSARQPNGLKIYAELAGDSKKRGIKNPRDNNLKTMENGITATYISAFSGYHHGKLFTAANKKRQARISWEEIQKFILIDPDLGDLFRVQDWKSMITALTTNCTIEALSKEAGLDDGFRSIFASVDRGLSTINRAKSVKAKPEMACQYRGKPSDSVRLMATVERTG